MTQPIIECIPNFSEGRRPEVVEEIANSIRATPGVTLLDSSMDADHNRCVITFVGDPAGVEAAAFAAIASAARLIDMTQHEGEHPRIGATDVVPFVPIQGATLADCVAIAQRLGQRVGDELGVPVYLYEEAATHPDRVKLATLRKGQYEGLREDIKTDPNRTPDFGPAELGTAGATVIGARPPLVAYNIYLNSDDVDKAEAIARAIRLSSGGLRFVAAKGFLVDGQAQVSMNLTDFTRTPIYRVQEMVRREAARYGLSVTYAELVGLVPEQALVDSARWYLQLDLFDEDQILERKLRAAQSGGSGAESFVEDVASGEPTPGGGSVGALAGALAAALAGMVARTTLGKKKYAEVEADMQAAAATADRLRGELMQAISEDAASFEAVLTAYRLSKEDTGRGAAIQVALAHATETPLRVAQLSAETFEMLAVVAGQGNNNAATDAAAGAYMALAAIESAALNVRVNALSLDDKDAAQGYLQTLGDVLEAARVRRDEVVALAVERAGLTS